MFALIACLFCNSALILILRINEEKAGNKYNMMLINYVITFALSVWAMDVSTLSAGGGVGTAVICGLINGTLYLVSLVAMQVGIQRNGTILTSTFSRLSVILPILISMIVFREQPTMVQVAGILVAVAAIFVMQWRFSGAAGQQGYAVWLLFAQFLLSGGSALMPKLFAELGEAELNNMFILVTFTTAMVLCLICKLKDGTPFHRQDVICGTALGIVNYSGARFLLLALQEIPAYIAYPVYNAGALVAVTIASVLIWKDRLKKRQAAGIAMIVAALILLNI